MRGVRGSETDSCVKLTGRGSSQGRDVACWGDVSRSDTWVAERTGPTQCREAESSGRHYDLQ